MSGDKTRGRPTIRRGLDSIWRGWMTLVGAFSWLLVRVATVFVFVVGFVPYGVVMRLVEFDPLDRDLDDRDSYWTEVESHAEDVEQFRRQY